MVISPLPQVVQMMGHRVWVGNPDASLFLSDVVYIVFDEPHSSIGHDNFFDNVQSPKPLMAYALLVNKPGYSTHYRDRSNCIFALDDDNVNNGISEPLIGSCDISARIANFFV